MAHAHETHEGVGFFNMWQVDRRVDTSFLRDAHGFAVLAHLAHVRGSGGALFQKLLLLFAPEPLSQFV